MSSEILKGKNGKWEPHKGTPWYKTPFMKYGVEIPAILKRGGKVRKTKNSERLMKSAKGKRKKDERSAGR
jgi:hypothetical protein